MINIRKKKKLLILGGSSLLSYIWCNAVCEEFDIYLSNNIKITSYLKFPVLKINLNSPENFAKILRQFSIDIVLNTIGLTNVEECENDLDKAYFLNAVLPGKIAKACFINETKLIHISTDHLYSNENKLHSEEDKVSLVNAYAKSKYEGEISALSNFSSALICRTNFFGYGPPHKNSFSDWIIKSSILNKVITLHNDVFYTPISGIYLANYAHKLIDNNCFGVYNISSNTLISKYQFGIGLSKLLGISSENIISGSIKSRDELMLRPTSMGLCNKKISEELKISIGGFQDQIKSIIS